MTIPPNLPHFPPLWPPNQPQPEQTEVIDWPPGHFGD